MPEYKLIYFNLKGRGELIRWIFEYGDIPYTEERIAKADWPIRKQSIPSGKVPVLMIDGKPLIQSMAIARYAAKEACLVPEDNIEAAYCDAATDTLQDIMVEFYKLQFLSSGTEDEKNKKFDDEIYPTHIEPVLTRMNERLEGRSWATSDKITWADLMIGYVFDLIRSMHPSLLKGFPVVEAHVNKILALPKIKEWIKKRPETRL